MSSHGAQMQMNSPNKCHVNWARVNHYFYFLKLFLHFSTFPSFIDYLSYRQPPLFLSEHLEY